MFNAQTPPYCYHWYAVFLKGQRRVPGDKVLPSDVCIKNFDFHNRRNSRNITGTDPRNRSILKHAWYPFRFPMRTSGIIIFFALDGKFLAAVFLGCVTSQKRLRGRLANSWTSSGVGHLSCQMTRGGDEKRGQQVLSPTRLSPSLCEKGGRKQRSQCSRAEALPEMGSSLETFSRQEKFDLLQL